MAALRELDPVAYVRFASVYRDFRDAADFHAVLRDLASDTRDPLELSGRFAPGLEERDGQKKH
jgi:transcriptional repressor NrdR